MDYSEQQIQAMTLRWVMEDKKSKIATLNITTIYNWECDVLSVSRAGLVSEWEIKRTKSDYRADFKKRKHNLFSHKNRSTFNFIPNYFWFVTLPMDIEIPEYAGWAVVDGSERVYSNAPSDLLLSIKKPAPRLHSENIRGQKMEYISRGLSFKLMNMYNKFYLHEQPRSLYGR